MTLRYFCPRWGSEAQPWPEFCRRVRDAGYDGVEASLPLDDPAARDALLEALDRTGLLLVAQH